MTGSIALDVAIGLVFIFLLYSLLATIIQEIIANLLGLRARNLRHALTRMLEDDKDKETSNIAGRIVVDSKQRLQRNFQRKKDGLIKEFYDQPIIKYLASGRYFSKPSYLNQSDFALALIELLKAKGQKVLDESLLQDKEDIKNIESALEKINKDDDLELSKILYDTLSYKEQRLLEEEGHAQIADIDKIKATLLTDTKGIDPRTKEHLIALLDDAQYDMLKFRINLENWFNHTMDRASGWYKKTIQFTLIIVGFIMAIIFDANTIEITKLLSKDKNAREALVNMATNYSEENPQLIKYLERREELNRESDSTPNNVDNMDVNNSAEASPNDSISESSQEEMFIDEHEETRNDDFESKLDELLEIKDALESDIEEAHNILGFRPVDNLPLKEKSEGYNLKPNQKEFIDTCDNKTYILDFPNALLADKTYAYYKLEKRNVEDQKVAYADFDYMSYLHDHFWENFWGYLITALAISLGAPFWFDLLSKLIRIRGSIQSRAKTHQYSSTSTSGDLSVNQRVG